MPWGNNNNAFAIGGEPFASGNDTALSGTAGFFQDLLLEHLQLSAISIALALVAGLALGILIAQQDKLSLPVLGTINFIYTIPSIALFGFLLPFTGIGNKSAIIALTVYALLPVVRNTHAGLTNIDPVILEAGTGMGSTSWQLLWKIKLPLAMPIIIAGIRNMVVMVIATCGIAAFIGAGGWALPSTAASTPISRL